MIVAARVGLLLLCAAAVAWAVLVPGPRPAAAQHICPMHAEVRAPGPGQCPVCAMALVKEEAPAVERGASEARRFLSAGVAPVHRRVLSEITEAPAWLDEHGGVTAALYDDEWRALGPKAPGSFYAARAPEVALAVEAAEAPARPGPASSWLVRFRFRDGGSPPGLRVGASGRIELPANGRASLVVISSAVLQAEAGPYLLAVAPDGRHRRQPITTGRRTGGYTVVLSGVRERALVVGINAFAADAEITMQAQRRASGLAP